MKTHAILTLGLIISLHVSCQSTEFHTYPNGLIYNNETMGKLGHIVDSLNLKFKACDLNKIFYSKSQNTGHIVRLKKGNLKQAKMDMENQMPFDDFVIKYPGAEVERDVLIVKFKYKNYKGEEIVDFNHIDFDSDYGMEVSETNNPKIYEKDVAKTWLYEYYDKSQYSEESLNAFYFPKNFEAKSLPDKYARMVGYADCLIDTTTLKFKEDAEEGWVMLPKNWENLSQKKKEALLEEMRSTKVVGFCSQDSRPREHAMNIAVLSAETTNWEVFLRAHLDIMNDRFERMSDGSYAWGQRNTYIRELEELDINVSDLIFGISMRVENPATNHYYGSIGRTGRALSETKNVNEIEKNMLSMIEDTELDDYNRVLAYFLFLNYNYHIKGEAEKKENIAQLKSSVEKLPGYIKSKITIKEK